MMDARKDRIGEHAADHALPWAVNALGPVPGHPLDRLDWQRRASSIGAWRELSGYDHPADPIGPEPAAAAPDLRAAWHEALAALGPADGPDVRGMPDGMLLHLRDTYPLETAWAPQYVGDELRQVRAAAWDARLAAVRAAAEADAAQRRGQPDEAARQQALAASYQAMHDAYAEREAIFAAVMADRADWDAATRHQRHLAVAADAELRRRHPARSYPPLRSAEPPPPTQAQRDELTLTAGEQIPENGPVDQGPGRPAPRVRRQLADRQSLMIPAEDPDYGDLGQAFPPWPAPAREPSCNRPSPRSSHPSGSWNAPSTADWTWKPRTDSSHDELASRCRAAISGMRAHVTVTVSASRLSAYRSEFGSFSETRHTPWRLSQKADHDRCSAEERRDPGSVVGGWEAAHVGHDTDTSPPSPPSPCYRSPVPPGQRG